MSDQPIIRSFEEPTSESAPVRGTQDLAELLKDFRQVVSERASNIDSKTDFLPNILLHFTNHGQDSGRVSGISSLPKSENGCGGFGQLPKETVLLPNIGLTPEPASAKESSGHSDSAPGRLLFDKPEFSKITEKDGKTIELQERPSTQKNIDEFKVRWNESARKYNLDSGPFGPVIKELGEQLASGKLNAEKIQSLLKSICYPNDELDNFAKQLHAFAADLHEMYGVKPIFEFSGRQGQGAVKSISIAEYKHNGFAPNASIKIAEAGQPQAIIEQRGFAGPSITIQTVDQVMNKFNGFIRSGRQDLHCDAKTNK